MHWDNKFKLRATAENDNNVCTSAALEGVDLWTEEKQVMSESCFMISDRLYKALKKEKLASRLGYTRFLVQ